MKTQEELLHKLEKSYSEIQNNNRNLPGFFKNWQDNGFRLLNEKGLPNTKMENWKYTDITKAIQPEFSQILQRPEYSYKIEDIFRCDVPNLNTRTYTTLDGWFWDDESSLFLLDNGAVIGSFKQALLKYPELFEQHLGSLVTRNADAFSGMNAAFSTDGVFLYVPDNVSVEIPFQLIDIISADTDLLVNRRNLFVFGKNARADMVICDHSLNFNKSFTNSFTEIFSEKDAVVNITLIQNSSNNTSKNSSIFLKQKRSSSVSLNTISLHGGLIRNNIFAELAEPFAECNLNGLYLADRMQHIDNYTELIHAAPNCTSNQTYKGILDDDARGVFSGKVFVAKDAQKTQAYQTNNNILLKDTARADAKPQLEIYADDVKCSHGATVGQLDTEALFYLQSRGINYQEARMLLMFSFTADVINRISVEALRDRITNLVEKRLRGELSRCNHCVINCC